MTSVADQFQCQHNRLTVNWQNDLATLSCNYTVRNRLLLENHKLSQSSYHLPFSICLTNLSWECPQRVLSPYSPSFTGMYLQTTDRRLTINANQTMLTAEGTRAIYSPKCNLASKNPNAEDFVDVSMAIVRDFTSPSPTSLGSQ